MKFTELLKQKKELRIGFLGGSITEGGCGISVELGYRRLVTKALNEAFPENKIVDINAGIGGTASSLGVFRLNRDVLDKNVDMVIVEFAVNDDGHSDADFYMESIVRNILRFDRAMPIMFVYTVQKQMIDNGYAKGELPKSVIAHERVAEYYHIPSVNMGYEVYRQMSANGEDIMAYTVDSCHPNERGSRIYAETLFDALVKAEFDHVFPEKPLTGRELASPATYPADLLANEEWTLSKRRLPRMPYGYIYAYKPGSTLTYEFEGTTVGFIYLCDKENGKFTYSIDGSESKLRSTWDICCNQFLRDYYVILENDLEYGKHTLTLTVSDEKDDDAEGTYVRIGAFLVG